jgi:pantoate--beta-alanine ligase
MRVIETPQAMQTWSLDQKKTGASIAFVPTMGNLHAGHLALVDAAAKSADKIVVSIFVNPLQFGPNEDLDKYPRTFTQDRDKLAAKGVDVVYFPNTADMYPFGNELSTKVLIPPQLTAILCGRQRPGHFDGVTTVVAKLFNIVQPDCAVFGEKDFQQLFLIRRMVADLFLPLQIHSLPTVREPDGLAMSSRNGYLSLEERKTAPKLYKALVEAKKRFEAGGADIDSLCEQAILQLRRDGFEPEYLELRSVAGLQLIEKTSETDAVLLVAARLGTTRLIDNVLISLK